MFLRITLFYFVLVAWCSCNQILETKNTRFYVGTFTTSGSEGIYSVDMNQKSGLLSQPKLMYRLNSPSFISLSANNKFLFAAARSDGDAMDVLHLFSVNQKNGILVHLDSISTMGKGACFVESSINDSALFVANYSTGNVSMYDLDLEAGKLVFNSSFNHFGSGTDSARQKTPHAHSIRQDLEGEYIYSTDLGADKIYIYKNKEKQYEVVDSIMTLPGDGPRHMDFSSDRRCMAIVSELSKVVTLYLKDDNGLFTSEIERISIEPDTFQGKSKAADIHFSLDNRFIYVSNRGCESIIVIKLTRDYKCAQVVQTFATDINWPRNISIDPTGKFLLVANRYGNNIALYRRSVIDGTIGELLSEVDISEPVCIKF